MTAVPQDLPAPAAGPAEGIFVARAVVGGEIRHGLVEGDRFRPLLGDVFAALEPAAETMPLRDAMLLSPSEPGHVYVVLGGFAPLGGEDPRPLPRLIPKIVSTVGGDGSEIVIPRFVAGPVWAEAEVAVVVGSTLHRASRAEAARAIFGYACFNDASAPAYLEHGPSGYFQAKSIETFAAMGPWIRTDLREDDLRAGLTIEARINGVTQATGTTALARYAPSELLEFLSQHVTLVAGDVVSLGTPKPCEVEPGDAVEIEVEGIGVLRNGIVGEPSARPS